ncbi:DUF4139 domain-containing protein [Viscerimonas tarda]
MKLKIVLLTVSASLLISLNVFSEKKTVKSSLQTATVFFQGAELTHKASSALLKGENEIQIEGLSPNIDRNSLKINATGGAIITSYEYSIDHLNPQAGSATEKKLRDSISIYQKQIKTAEVKLKTNEDLLGLLQANKSIAGAQTGLSVAELVKMMDYYQSKSIELQNEKRSLEEIQEKSEERIYVLQDQLNQESVKNIKTSGVLKLSLTSPTNVSSDFTISYYTTASGWTPYYDINVMGIGNPIKIASKAKVKQTTGMDWDKVKLTLSTSAPSKGKIAPLFNAWFLAFQENYLYNRKMGNALVAQNKMSYDANALAEVVVSPKMMVREAASAAESGQPLIIVDGKVVTQEERENIDPNMIKNVEVVNGADATSLYGSRATNGVILITLKNSMGDFVSQEENQLNKTYSIALPYTIEGNGKEQSIDLQTLDVPAKFSYYSAPKLDGETFLVAEISNWEQLGLLTGNANITYDGTYVGKTLIDVNSTLEKLALTLGTDKRVTVKREKLQDFSSKKFLGNDTKQEFVYQLTVKNNQNQAIKMILKDQYPLSTQKEIEVEILKETTATTHRNEEVGVLVWEFELKPGETRTFKTAYSVKYPKDKTLNL